MQEMAMRLRSSRRRFNTTLLSLSTSSLVAVTASGALGRQSMGADLSPQPPSVGHGAADGFCIVDGWVLRADQIGNHAVRARMIRHAV
jgi:hypothetical protein